MSIYCVCVRAFEHVLIAFMAQLNLSAHICSKPQAADKKPCVGTNVENGWDKGEANKSS